jgi:hypothetical protein
MMDDDTDLAAVARAGRVCHSASVSVLARAASACAPWSRRVASASARRLRVSLGPPRRGLLRYDTWTSTCPF